MSDYPQYPVPPSQPGSTPQPAARGPRPASVDLAVKLIWTLIALSVVSALLTFLSLDAIVDQALEDAGVSEDVDADLVRSLAIAGGVIGLIIGVGINALLAVFIGKGANWARITYTVLAGIGVLFSLLGYVNGSAFAQPVALMLLGLVSLAVTVTVLVLLWRRESNAWFARPRFSR